MAIRLAQRGRALMDFEVTARQTASRLQQAAEQELAARGITPATLPENMDDRHRAIDAALADSAVWRLRALLGEWCAANHGLAAEAAFAEVRDEVVPELDGLRNGPTTIDYRPGFAPPAYWERTWFHRTHGGWEGDPYQGFIHSELVHQRYVAKVFPGDIYANRRLVARLAPRADYGRILEIGTSSGHYTVALSEVFPGAEIWGIDPSARMLEQAQRVANERGLAWKLLVGVGEDTGLESESFDLVTAYAVHHEIPPRAVNAIFAEAYRLLKPGGDVLIADVARYADLDRMAAWRFDWTARWGGEPFWRATASMDFAESGRKAGFINVASGALEPRSDPYWVRGTKPE